MSTKHRFFVTKASISPYISYTQDNLSADVRVKTDRRLKSLEADLEASESKRKENRKEIYNFYDAYTWDFFLSIF